jgi:hypothetical protein
MKIMFFFCMLCGLSVPASAQVFGPVAVPVTSENSFGSRLSLEVGGGANLVTRRKPIASQFTSAGLEAQFGYRLGVKLVLRSPASVSLVLGGELVGDRTVLQGLSRADSELRPSRRVGDVTISEQWFRTSLGLRCHFGRFAITPAFQISSFLGGRQDYAFRQVVTSLFDPVTGREIALEQPQITEGTTDLANNNIRGYTGGMLGVRYALTDRLSLVLDYESGFHLDRTALNKPWRQRRSRLGLAAYYGFFGNQ